MHIGEVQKVTINEVDDKDVPVPHFGVILEWDIFDVLSQRITAADIKFVIEPYLRFKGEAGEQKLCSLKTLLGMLVNSNLSKMILRSSKNSSQKKYQLSDYHQKALNDYGLDDTWPDRVLINAKKIEDQFFDISMARRFSFCNY